MNISSTLKTSPDHLIIPNLRTQVLDSQIRDRAMTAPGPWKPRLAVIPGDWNQSPPVLKPWDHYLVDIDIGRVMSIVYENKPGRDFAQSNCPTKNCHFSPPYSTYARDNYGFGAVHVAGGFSQNSQG